MWISLKESTPLLIRNPPRPDFYEIRFVGYHFTVLSLKILSVHSLDAGAISCSGRKRVRYSMSEVAAFLPGCIRGPE